MVDCVCFSSKAYMQIQIMSGQHKGCFPLFMLCSYFHTISTVQILCYSVPPCCRPCSHFAWFLIATKLYYTYLLETAWMKVCSVSLLCTFWIIIPVEYASQWWHQAWPWAQAPSAHQSCWRASQTSHCRRSSDALDQAEQRWSAPCLCLPLPAVQDQFNNAILAEITLKHVSSDGLSLLIFSLTLTWSSRITARCIARIWHASLKALFTGYWGSW